MCAANAAGECTSAYSNEAIATAYTFIGAPSYEDSTLSGAPAGTVIKRAHVAQLRVGATRGVGASGGGGGGGGTTGGVRWMVHDQLGTPRMTVDLSGSLAGVRRRDFLPFGEELTVGGRTTGQGYLQPSGIRQGFTGYEKDGETELNFAQRRYYSPTQGRFTSPDQPLVDQWADDPQSWNLYTYVRNNPLNLVDPFGMVAECPRGWEGCVEKDGKFYWPHPDTGELTEINDSVIKVDSDDSGVPRDGGGPNLPVGEALKQQEDRRNNFIVANVLTGVGYGLGRVFGSIGGLFRRSPQPISPTPIPQLSGSKASSGVANRTIQIVQREGNLFEMVGKSAKGEIRVLTEMTRQGDALVLKGLHMEGPGAGSMGLRELRELARQLGRAQGVNRVIVQGGMRTTGANPGHVPRTIEIKVN